MGKYIINKIQGKYIINKIHKNIFNTNMPTTICLFIPFKAFDSKYFVVK